MVTALGDDPYMYYAETGNHFILLFCCVVVLTKRHGVSYQAMR